LSVFGQDLPPPCCVWTAKAKKKGLSPPLGRDERSKKMGFLTQNIADIFLALLNFPFDNKKRLFMDILVTLRRKT